MGFIEVTRHNEEHGNSNWNRTNLLRSRSSPKRRKILRHLREDWQSGDAAKRKLLLHTILETVSVSGREVQTLTLHSPFAHFVRAAKNGVVDTEGRMFVWLSETGKAVSSPVA